MGHQNDAFVDSGDVRRLYPGQMTHHQIGNVGNVRYALTHVCIGHFLESGFNPADHRLQRPFGINALRLDGFDGAPIEHLVIQQRHLSFQNDRFLHFPGAVFDNGSKCRFGVLNG